MAFLLRLLVLAAFMAVVIEFAQAKDLKEIAKALREKRENEIALQQKAEDELVARNKRQGGGCGGGRGGGCGGGGGGCGCCCCCCCCCCGCGKKKRDILSVLRAKRNDIADDVTKAVANDWGYSGNSGAGEYDNGAGYGRGSGYGGEVGGGNNDGYNGEGPCPKCDGEN